MEEDWKKAIAEGDKLFEKELFADAVVRYLMAYEKLRVMENYQALGDLCYRISQSYLYEEHPDIKKAEEFARLALEYHTKASSLRDVARDHLQLGNIKMEENVEEAKREFQEALRIAEDIRDASIASEVYNSMGILHWNEDREKAEEYFKKGLEVARAGNDLEGIVVSCQHLGYLERERGNYEKAMNYFIEGIEAVEEAARKVPKRRRKKFRRAYSDVYDDAADLAMETEQVERAMEIAKRLEEE